MSGTARGVESTLDGEFADSRTEAYNARLRKGYS
jgi:hypothetical protein